MDLGIPSAKKRRPFSIARVERCATQADQSRHTHMYAQDENPFAGPLFEVPPHRLVRHPSPELATYLQYDNSRTPVVSVHSHIRPGNFMGGRESGDSNRLRARRNKYVPPTTGCSLRPDDITFRFANYRCFFCPRVLLSAGGKKAARGFATPGVQTWVATQS